MKHTLVFLRPIIVGIMRVHKPSRAQLQIQCDGSTWHKFNIRSSTSLLCIAATAAAPVPRTQQPHWVIYKESVYDCCVCFGWQYSAFGPHFPKLLSYKFISFPRGQSACLCIDLSNIPFPQDDCSLQSFFVALRSAELSKVSDFLELAASY